MSTLAIILIAAGNSSRLGQAKQLIRRNDHSLLNQAIHLAYSASTDVNCVLGFNSSVFTRSIQQSFTKKIQLPKIIINAEWQQGMGTSIASGIKQISEDAQAAMILLCDQWALIEQDIQKLVTMWQKNPDKIIAAQYHDPKLNETVRGAPVIFPRQYFSALTELKHTGARMLLRQMSSQVIAIDLKHAAFDLDTADDLQTMRRNDLLA